MIIGEKKRLIYPIFCGRAKDPVPNERIYKLNIEDVNEPELIFFDIISMKIFFELGKDLNDSTLYFCDEEISTTALFTVDIFSLAI